MTASTPSEAEDSVTPSPPVGGDVAAAGVIWTRPYVALGSVVFLNYLNQSAIRPLLPLYVLYLGGTETIAGVALFAFSLVSFSIRPTLGRLIDRSEAARVMIVGSLLLCVFTAGMSVSVLWVAIAMFTIRGTGWAAINASSTALLAHLAPPSRRGEAAGYYSLFQSTATTLGPAVALYWVTDTDDYTPVFLVATACSIVAWQLCGPLRNVERSSSAKRPARRPTAGDESRWLARSALVPSILLIFLTLPQAAVLGFFPLYGESIGLTPLTITSFYVISGVGAILGRAILGRVSDKTGRGAAILAGFVLEALSLFAILQSEVVPLLLVAAALFSLGQGTTLPAVTALAIDRAGRSGEVGHSMATFSASFQVGLGAGGLVAGVMIDAFGYIPMYSTMAAFAVIAIGVTIRLWGRFEDEPDELSAERQKDDRA